MFDIISMPVKIEIKHCTKKYTKILNKIEENTAIGLNIEVDHQISNKELKTPAIITISIGNYMILSDKIDVRTNVIGVLKSTGEISVSLIFRVINISTDKIILHNVKQFHKSDFKFTRKLGEGSFGQTHEVIDSLLRLHVLKIMLKKIEISNKDDSSIREIIPFLAFPKHPCLIKLEGFIYDRDCGIILVLEYAEQGVISSINFNELAIDKKLKLLYGLFSCVAFLHDNGFVHRDIHPSNVLITDEYETKLIDFGVSRFLGKEMTDDVGHQGYQSPEIWKSNEYDALVDEYSLGVLLDHLDNEETFFKLISLLLKANEPNMRITCSEICTLIESEMLHSNTKENEDYFIDLSQYQQSKPVRDSVLWNIIANITVLDIIKLLSIAEYQDSKIYLDVITLLINGIAFDTELFSLLIYVNKADTLDLSADKFDLLYNYYLDRCLREEYFNYLFFNIYCPFDFYAKYLEILSDTDIMEMTSYMISKLNEKWRIIRLMLQILTLAQNRNKLFYAKNVAIYAYNNKKIHHDLMVEYLKLVGKLGCNESLCYLAQHYINKIEGGRDRGIYYAKLALKNNYYQAAKILFELYRSEKNREKTIKYIKIYAENEKDPYYLCNLGFLYIFQDKNVLEGIEYVKTSAYMGFAEAQYVLALMNFYGYKVPQNFDQAHWYNYLALQQQNLDGLYIYGLYLFFGISIVEQDYVKAKDVFEQCIAYYNSKKTADSRYMAYIYHSLDKLSIIHLFGLGVNISIKRANELLYECNKHVPDSSVYGSFLDVVEYIEETDSYVVNKDERKIVPRNVLLDQALEEQRNLSIPKDSTSIIWELSLLLMKIGSLFY